MDGAEEQRSMLIARRGSDALLDALVFFASFPVRVQKVEKELDILVWKADSVMLKQARVSARNRE